MLDIQPPPSEPTVDISKLTEEVKAYMQENKIKHVDYSYTSIEMWPDPNDDKYPELKKFAAEFEAVFTYADSVTGEEGQNFPEDIIQNYEAVCHRVKDSINEDTVFWDSIRAEVLPLYSPHSPNPSEQAKKRQEYWEGRWKSIKFWYDPIGTEVQTSKLMRAKNADGSTGEIKSRDLISKRVIPPGFVIDVQ